MSKSSEAVKNWRKKSKERLIAGFGGKCGICLYNRTNNALELHHLDPNEKEFGFGSIRANCINWDKIAQEASKCVLLCSNCHREVHAGLISDKEINKLPRFDAALCEVVLLQNELFYCECGSIKKKNAKFCSNVCFKSHRNEFGVKVNWNLIDLDELSKTLSNVEIGVILGVSEAAVRKRKRKLKKLS
jgi:hypothetical protein